MKTLKVSFDWGNEIQTVGTLAEHGRDIHFEFSPSFLESPLPISPFMLKVTGGIQRPPDNELGGLFGVFADSLPDGWGLLLMDRVFREVGNSSPSMLDRLSYVGEAGIGALIYQPTLEYNSGLRKALDLRDISRQAERIIAGSPEEVLPELAIAGGSAGGARPKVLVNLDSQTQQMSLPHGRIPRGEEGWLIKFRSQGDFRDSGLVEYAYAKMAGQAGVNMSETRLFEAGDEVFFGTRRFDQVPGQRFHVHTLGGLLQASHRLAQVDYETYLRVVRALTQDYQALLEAYRQAMFNYFSYNRDDHVKNFSFIMNSTGEWKIAPAYDLMFSTGINGWHSMDFGSGTQHPTLQHLFTLAEKVGIDMGDAKEIIERVRDATHSWTTIARDLNLSAETTQIISERINMIQTHTH